MDFIKREVIKDALFAITKLKTLKYDSTFSPGIS